MFHTSSVTRCKGHTNEQNFYRQDAVTRSLLVETKTEATSRWKDGTRWREVTWWLVFEHQIQRYFDSLKLQKFPPRHREYIYTYTYRYISIRYIYYNTAAAGPEEATEKGRYSVCLIIKEISPRALARGFKVTKVPPVTVDLLKSLTSTSFHSEGSILSISRYRCEERAGA